MSWQSSARFLVPYHLAPPLKKAGLFHECMPSNFLLLLNGLKAAPVHGPAGPKKGIGETKNRKAFLALKSMSLKFLSDEGGATAIEYGLIAALISVVFRWSAFVGSGSPLLPIDSQEDGDDRLSARATRRNWWPSKTQKSTALAWL